MTITETTARFRVIHPGMTLYRDRRRRRTVDLLSVAMVEVVYSRLSDRVSDRREPDAGPARHGGLPVWETLKISSKLPAGSDKPTPRSAGPEPTVASSAAITGTEE